MVVCNNVYNKTCEYQMVVCNLPIIELAIWRVCMYHMW